MAEYALVRLGLSHLFLLLDEFRLVLLDEAFLLVSHLFQFLALNLLYPDLTLLLAQILSQRGLIWKHLVDGSSVFVVQHL